MFDRIASSMRAISPELGFTSCEVLLFDPEAAARRKITIALEGLGFRRITGAGDPAAMCAAAADGGIDLMLCRTAPADGGMCDLVRRLRHGTFGRDPFPGIIMFTAAPAAELVRRAIDSGPDHVIRWPFSNRQIAARVDSIVNARRPFVVTVDYIGPDRRRDTRRPSKVELIEVPNSLRAKARKDIRAAATHEAIAAATARINLHRIRRCYPAVGVLIEQIHDGFARGVPHGERAASLVRLIALIADLQRRVVGTEHADASALCAALASIAEKMRLAGEAAAPEAFELLKRTGLALYLSFEPQMDAAAVSVEISSTVAMIRQRAAAAR